MNGRTLTFHLLLKIISTFACGNIKFWKDGNYYQHVVKDNMFLEYGNIFYIYGYSLDSQNENLKIDSISTVIENPFQIFENPTMRVLNVYLNESTFHYFQASEYFLKTIDNEKFVIVIHSGKIRDKSILLHTCKVSRQDETSKAEPIKILWIEGKNYSGWYEEPDYFQNYGNLTKFEIDGIRYHYRICDQFLMMLNGCEEDYSSTVLWISIGIFGGLFAVVSITFWMYLSTSITLEG